MEVSSFAAGCIAGAAGQLVGHPLDTIKVYAQTVGTTAKPLAWSVLMRGVAAPVASAGAIQSLNLGLYDNLRRQLAPGRAREDTPLARVALAAAGAGACVALVTCPQQRVKIVQQLRGGRLAPTAAALWRERTLYRGLGAQVLFESSRSIYMATYEGERVDR